MTLLREGQMIRDTYQVERFVGEGAFAEVYRVRHKFLGRQAMKLLKTPGASLNDVEVMLAEASLLSRIGHPNIIRVFEANVLEMRNERFAFFTMEYVAGGSLDAFWRSYKNSLMPVSEAVEILKQVCAGVTVAHSENPPIVHRDIKPQNILVGYDATGLRARVSDFGLAKHVNPLTLLASCKGTLSFKPPESIENLDSPTADVWALGTTLYLLLTDTLPFPELDEQDLKARFVGQLRPGSVYNIAVNAELDSIIATCLAKNPMERYRDASGLLDALNRWSVGPQPFNATLESSSQEPKRALGYQPSHDSAEAKRMIDEALALSRRPNSLMSAADLLEEAINRAPELRDRYEAQLKLWRRGVSM